MPADSKVRVGVAGWAYDDWAGIVYPAPRPAKFDALAYLAGYFDCLEVNSSFYRPVTRGVTASWVQRTQAYPAFRFTVKLWRRFTHDRTPEHFERDATEVRRGLAPLVDSGRCGALLVQFPWSFKRTREDAAWLKRVVTTFAELRPVVELRHDSWLQPAVLDWLTRHRVGLCAIDQPLFDHSITPGALQTGRVGYVRLHGRNRDNWFREDAKVFERYDYLYSPEELEPWIARIREIAADSDETYAITNNHYRGQAVVNALQIKAALEGGSLHAPGALRETYPQIENITLPGPEMPSEAQARELFD